MKTLMILPFLAFTALTGCENKAVAPGVPACVAKSTKELSTYTSCSHGAYVKEFEFQQKTVYVLDPGDCTTESAAQVIDSDCRQLGYLGGFTGNRKINGVEFSANATFIRTIWKQ